ncbi:epimerase [Bacillus coahuilensis m2-6]|uniref:sugar nucleotide-binding protein n=1 Tax=Bacillus coahuilensis TaxID=408580 RepID=UPI0007501B70|nr:sugar nucleotide-binding protein [Bacillus coahuilensis]KUP09672.1 epimerase [Bacillus coahuilensis m2-6]
MKAIVTGMNGTVAPVLGEYLKTKGIEAIPWDREKVSTTDIKEMQAFFDHIQPTYFFHIGMGPAQWASTLATICFERQIPFLFTSTVSVFSEAGTGPYTVESLPDAEDDYGKYKRDCEEAIKEANPNAWIVRIGWQIGHDRGSNYMIDFLERTMDEKGFIPASSEWYPSTSFLEDTVEALYTIFTTKQPGLYLANGNPSYSFHNIVTALNQKHGGKWKVKETTDLKRDDRMFDDRVELSSIHKKLDI